MNVDRGDGPPTDSGTAEGDMLRLKVTFSCRDCDDFVSSKSYSGRDGTPGKEEYDRVQAPDECPVCGGRIERSGDAETEDVDPADGLRTDGGTDASGSERRLPEFVDEARCVGGTAVCEDCGFSLRFDGVETYDEARSQWFSDDHQDRHFTTDSDRLEGPT